MSLVARSALLGAVLAVLQVIFTVASGYKDTPSPVRLCEEYLEEEKDMIYLGESTLYYTDPQDTDKAPINEMLQRLLPEYGVGCIAHDAYHLELYEAFCAYIAGKEKQPELVIVPINLGTVSAYWGMRPEYQFERIKLFLRNDYLLFRLFYRPLAVLRAFDLNPISRREYEHAVVYDGEKPVGHITDFLGPEYEEVTPERRKEQLVLRYMEALDANHPKVKAVGNIARSASKSRYDVLFYLTPIDYETGNRYLGKRFESQIRENKSVFLDETREASLDVLDLSLDLPPDCFYWASRYVNEHMNQRGRRYVARRLASAVRARLTRK